MKKTFRLIAMALMAGAMFTACGGDDETKTPGTQEPPKGDFPPVEITQKPSGSVKAGVVGAIEVLGGTFDPEMDLIRIGYTDESGKLVTEVLNNDAEVFIKGSRITAGIPIGSATLGKKATLYLDRPGYTMMPITEELTVNVPEVKDGFIPDAAFRATLKTQNNNVVFNPLGLVDVEAAAIMKSGATGADGTYGLNLYGCQAASLEGIELFKSVEGLVVGWGGTLTNLKNVDFSNWQARNIDIRFDESPALESFIASPWCGRIRIYSCPKLTTVDVHNSRWLKQLEISNTEKLDQAKQSAVTLLDIRRNCDGNFKEGSGLVADTDYTLWNGGSQGFKVANDATIRIDTYFLVTHIAGGGHSWDDIYDAWKNKNATIEVYSRKSPGLDTKLGTVPAYSVQPDALAPTNNLGGDDKPANKWQIDDPNTPENEAPDMK